MILSDVGRTGISFSHHRISETATKPVMPAYILMLGRTPELLVPPSLKMYLRKQEHNERHIQ